MKKVSHYSQTLLFNFLILETGNYHCPILRKEFTDKTSIVMIRTSGNVYCKDAVEELNVKAENWFDLISGQAFNKDDILVIQDPKHPEKRFISSFQHIQEETALANGLFFHHLLLINGSDFKNHK